jgi:hypothetical protein
VGMFLGYCSNYNLWRSALGSRLKIADEM